MANVLICNYKDSNSSRVAFNAVMLKDRTLYKFSYQNPISMGMVNGQWPYQCELKNYDQEIEESKNIIKAYFTRGKNLTSKAGAFCSTTPNLDTCGDAHENE